MNEDHKPILCPNCNSNSWNLLNGQFNSTQYLLFTCSKCEHTVSVNQNQTVEYLLLQFTKKDSWLKGGKLIKCPVDNSETWELYNWDGEHIQVKCMHGSCYCDNATYYKSKAEVILELIEADAPQK